MLAFLALALVVAVQSTVGRVSLDRVSRALLARVFLLVERARIFRWRVHRSLIARFMILAERARTRRRRAVHNAERCSLFALSPQLVQKKELKSVNPIIQDLLSAVATTGINGETERLFLWHLWLRDVEPKLLEQLHISLGVALQSAAHNLTLLGNLWTALVLAVATFAPRCAASAGAGDAEQAVQVSSYETQLREAGAIAGGAKFVYPLPGNTSRSQQCRWDAGEALSGHKMSRVKQQRLHLATDPSVAHGRPPS
ncbi:hypothetical protein T492DRAFT_908584 [Pavlovales sp. CCMP2436]|nr:hypothetical protein T492DRAFT_908584 [Pavlovales sp. CCMP2436]